MKAKKTAEKLKPIYIGESLHHKLRDKVHGNGQSIKFITEKLVGDYINNPK